MTGWHSVRNGLLLGFCCFGISGETAAQSRDEERKRDCARYEEMVDFVLESMGQDILTSEFQKQNEAYIASGCLSNEPACPISEMDYSFADLLTIMTIDAGMASTFTPFRCPGTGE